MNIASNPHRVAHPTVTRVPVRTSLPRLWLDLPAQTQKQIAQCLASMLLRHRASLAPEPRNRHAERGE